MDVFLSCVAAGKRSKLARYHRQADTYRSLLGELLVRLAASRCTGRDNGSLSFEYNSYGKPFLREAPEFRFNISHSGEWVVIIYSVGELQVGVDVEQIAPMDMKIAESCFSREENRDLSRYSGQERLDYFFRLWTLKESYVKALGKGLSVPLSSFSLTHTEDEQWHCKEAPGYRFASFRLDPAHLLAACSNGPLLPEMADLITLDELYRHFSSQG